MNISPIKRFWKVLRQYKPEIRQIYAYAIFNGIINLTLPLGIQAIINYIQTGELTSSWIVLVCFVLLGIGISGLLQVLQLRIVENIQQDLFARSAFEFAYRFPKIKFLQLDKIHAPELANRFFDTLTIQKGLPKVLIDFSLAVFQIVFGLVLLAIYSPYFILLGLLLFFILYVIYKVTAPRGLSTSLSESKFKYKVAHWLEEIARVNRTFKMNATSDLHLNRTDDMTGAYLKARENHFKVILQQFWMFIGFKVIVAAGLLALGGFLVFNDQMTLGQFVAAEIIIILIINSVEKVIKVIETIYDVLTALEKIGHVTDLDLDSDGGSITLDLDKPFSIEANDLSFQFTENITPILNDLSFAIPAGSRTQIKGPSGSGKSLLLQILAGIHPLNSGDLFINDIRLHNLNKKFYFGNIGAALSANQLFEGTFLENITLGRDIDKKVLSETCTLLRLNDYFKHQPHGMDSLVDTEGRRLPRSIIQKLMIARIIVQQPKLILLEDPMQFIQEEEKIAIIDYLCDVNRPWTLVVISDFHHWAEKCNHMITLKN